MAKLTRRVPAADSSGSRKVGFTNLKPKRKSISLELPVSLLEQIKVMANKYGVSHSDLMKIWLAEKAKYS